MKRLHEAFNAPIHFTLSQQDGKRTISFRIFPIVLLLIVALLFITISVAVLTALASDKQTVIAQQIEISEIRMQYQKLLRQESETNALLSLRNAQIDAMRQEQDLLRREQSEMQTRLDMFNEVLAARKVQGLHVLRPVAYWRGDASISYNLILVKGQNFPRWQKGELSFSVINKQGEQQPLLSQKGRSKYKFDMTTQEFVSGVLKWDENWQPEELIITLNDLTHRKVRQINLPILNHAHALSATKGNVK